MEALTINGLQAEHIYINVCIYRSLSGGFAILLSEYDCTMMIILKVINYCKK